MSKFYRVVGNQHPLKEHGQPFHHYPLGSIVTGEVVDLDVAEGVLKATDFDGLKQNLYPGHYEPLPCYQVIGNLGDHHCYPIGTIVTGEFREDGALIAYDHKGLRQILYPEHFQEVSSMPKEYIVTGNRNAVGRVYHSCAIGSKVNEAMARNIKPEDLMELKQRIPMVYYINDECGLDIGDEFQWVVVNYTADTYDGWGEAVGRKHDGTLWSIDLCHCSCYGPGEEDSWTRVLDNWQDQFCDWSDELYAKVKELLAT